MLRIEPFQTGISYLFGRKRFETTPPMGAFEILWDDVIEVHVIW